MWRKIQRFLGTLLPTFLFLLLLAVAVCFLNRWDTMVPVTLIPIWAWAAFGMVVSAISWAIARNIPSVVSFCLWMTAGIGFSEETHGIVREVMHSFRAEDEESIPAERKICVVNLNCNGSETPLQRMPDLEPNIILVQKAPAESALRDLADKLWGVERAILVHQDSAILARGEFLNTLTEPEAPILHVRLRLKDGTVIDITNLTLGPCRPTLEMWQPKVWPQLIEAREANRRHLRTYLGENPVSVGRIVGGNFNTPPGDDVFRPLVSADLHDIYPSSGITWGNTYPGAYPMLRLDQIWVSENLTPIETITRRNPESEHSTVITWLALPEK